jgi:hypothetical protein
MCYSYRFIINLTHLTDDKTAILAALPNLYILQFSLISLNLACFAYFIEHSAYCFICCIRYIVLNIVRNIILHILQITRYTPHYFCIFSCILLCIFFCIFCISCIFFNICCYIFWIQFVYFLEYFLHINFYMLYICNIL